MTRLPFDGCALRVECGTEGDAQRWEVVCEPLTHRVNDDDDIFSNRAIYLVVDPGLSRV